MAMRIVKPDNAPPARVKAEKRPDYLAWLHTLPCAVTGGLGVEAAHLSYSAPRYGHYGRARGKKAPDRWALPLSPVQHRRQHGMNERDFWARTGINPHELALTLWGIYSDFDGYEATVRATSRILSGVAIATAKGE